jgi:RNA polymerase sigma-70 factor (ECF subfamily)
MTAEALAPLPFPLAGSGSRAPQEPMDEARFEIFYRRTAGGLWAYLHRLSGDAATADDLLQKAYFRILRANPAVADDDHLRRYLYRTATNLALDHFRETKRERGGSIAREVPIARSDGTELSHDVQRVFAELKPRERALLWLAHVEGSDHDEIGTALGLKSKSVRVLLFRARKRLGELLQKKGIGPEVMR